MASTADLQKVPDEAGDTFPYSGMRLLSVMQVNVGVLVFVLGVVDLVLTHALRDRYGDGYQLVLTLTVVSAPLWCGLWFCITGALGTSLSRDREPSLLFCKIGYLLLNVLCCALFGPVCAVISGYIAYSRHNLDSGDYQWLIALILCFLAVIEFLLSAVGSSIGCCCSTLRPTQIHVYVDQRDLARPKDQLSSNREHRPCPCPACDETNKPSNHHGLIRPNLPSPADSTNNASTPPHPLMDRHTTETDGGHLSHRQLDSSHHHLEYSRTILEPISGYPTLKKWALPRL